jgi:hypothetical protein
MIIKWAVIGALVGFFVFHPLIHLISVFHASSGQKVEIDLVSEILTAFSVSMLPWSLAFVIFSALIGIFYRKNKDANEKKSKLVTQLQESLAEIKTLSGLLPICSSCKNIRDDKGYWNQIEVYISGHSEAEFSHSICPECAKKLYPDIYAGK